MLEHLGETDGWFAYSGDNTFLRIQSLELNTAQYVAHNLTPSMCGLDEAVNNNEILFSLILRLFSTYLLPWWLRG